MEFTFFVYSSVSFDRSIQMWNWYNQDMIVSAAPPPNSVTSVCHQPPAVLKLAVAYNTGSSTLLCADLERWDEGGRREVWEGGMYVYTQWVHVQRSNAVTASKRKVSSYCVASQLGDCEWRLHAFIRKSAAFWRTWISDVAQPFISGVCVCLTYYF